MLKSIFCPPERLANGYGRCLAIWLAVGLAVAPVAIPVAQAQIVSVPDGETGPVPEPEIPPPPSPPSAAVDLPGVATAEMNGRSVSVPVQCTGFEQVGTVRVRSDPGAGAGVDGNGDGMVVDVTANRSTGTITLDLVADNASYSFATKGAEVLDNGLTFEVTMYYSGGTTERFTLTVNCNG